MCYEFGSCETQGIFKSLDKPTEATIGKYPRWKFSILEADIVWLRP